MRKYMTSLPLAAGILLTIGALILLVQQLSGVSSDALLSLISATVGALIVTASQSWTSFLDRRNQLRLTALEKRLEAHQQAYSLWRKLLANAHDGDTIGSIVLNCQDWWENNCLYLDPKAREAFQRAFMCAFDHPHFVQDRTNPELVKQNWSDIMAAGKAIVSGVALPTVGEQEAKIIGKGS